MGEKKVPFLVVHSYGFATMSFNLMMLVAVYYYSYFLTDVALIKPVHLIFFMVFTHLVDGLSIPVGGAVIQKTQFRWGQYRSWLLFMPLSTLVFFTLTFTNLNSVNYLFKIFFLGTAYLFSHVGLNFAYNAHIGLISVLSPNVDERAKLSTRNIQYQYGSQITFSVLAVWFLNWLRANYGESLGFFITVIILAGIQVLGYWNLFIQSKEYDRYDPNKKLKPAYNLTLPEMIKQIFGNKPLLTIMIADTLKDVAIFGLVSVAVYYFKYVTGDDSWVRSYSLVTASSILLSTFIAPYIIKIFGKKKTCIYSAFVGIIGYIVLHMFGDNGPITYITIISFTNIVVYLPMPVRQAMYLDAAEYGYYQTGKDATAFIMSMYTMPVKIGIALALGILPTFQYLVGYVANMEATPEFISSLMNLIAFLPLTCYLLAGFVFIFYGLTDEKVAFYMSENQKKRAEAES